MSTSAETVVEPINLTVRLSTDVDRQPCVCRIGYTQTHDFLLSPSVECFYNFGTYDCNWCTLKVQIVVRHVIFLAFRCLKAFISLFGSLCSAAETSSLYFPLCPFYAASIGLYWPLYSDLPVCLI